MAKSFIVLGDSFVERGDIRQAEATYESILEGYSPEGESDDVASSIELRIQKLKELEKEVI